MTKITLDLDETPLEALFVFRIYANQLTYLEITPIKKIT